MTAPTDYTDTRPGDTLPNGSVVVAVTWPDPDSGGVVLAITHPGTQWAEYATWRIAPEGATFWGHYSRTLAAAVADYTDRCDRLSMEVAVRS